MLTALHLGWFSALLPKQIMTLTSWGEAFRAYQPRGLVSPRRLSSKAIGMGELKTFSHVFSLGLFCSVLLALTWSEFYQVFDVLINS